MGTLANIEDPDEMQYDAAFHKGLRCKLKLKRLSETDLHYNLENCACEPLMSTMSGPILIVLISLGKSIRLQRVNI